MNLDELKEKFKQQIRDAVFKYGRECTAQHAESLTAFDETDIRCAFAAGMLIIVSAFQAKDGPTIAAQLAVMHKAIREVGEENKWVVSRQ